MTVGRMMAEMSYAELVDWMGLDSLRRQEFEKAQRQAKKGMNPKRPRRRR